MHVQLILFLSLLIGSAHAVDDKSMKELFAKYSSVMDSKKTDLIDEVFTKKFIKASGGKEELIEKIKELPTPKNKAAIPELKMTWRKARKGDLYLAKVTEAFAEKAKREASETEFIVVNEDGKLKIDGTLGESE